MININEPVQAQNAQSGDDSAKKAADYNEVIKEEHYKLGESKVANENTSVGSIQNASSNDPAKPVINDDLAKPIISNDLAKSTISNDFAKTVEISSIPSTPLLQPETGAPGQDNNTMSAKNELDISQDLQEMLSFTVEKDASDLHIAVGFPPFIRLVGKLVPIHNQDMSEDFVEKLLMNLLHGRLKQEFNDKYDVDFSYAHSSGNRFRVNIFKSKGQLAAAFRLIPQKIKSVSELGLPEVCYELINVPHGLILFTGPTGSGKSTSIAALMQEININTERHIITIEDPIEYVLPRGRALVNQREIGVDTIGWQRALREILRQDPNVVLVGEMRDYETIASTVTIAETGHLVFSTLHTNSASQSVDRIIDVFPQGQQNQIRSQLANVITAIIAQRLVPVKQGGRKAVFEVMIATPAIKNAIREGKTYQIDNMIQTSADIGMIPLEKSLIKLVKSSEITVEEALTYTTKPEELMSLLNNS